jgi:hypothetical protein
VTESGKACVGTGYFQWNAGGWFGSSFGSVAWMLMASGILCINGQLLLALFPALTFTVVLLTSYGLWQRRDRIRPFTAMMILFGVLSVAIPLVWSILSTFASPQSRTAMNWHQSTAETVLVFSFAPMLLVWFCVLERTHSKAVHS